MPVNYLDSVRNNWDLTDATGYALICAPTGAAHGLPAVPTRVVWSMHSALYAGRERRSLSSDLTRHVCGSAVPGCAPTAPSRPPPAPPTHPVVDGRVVVRLWAREAAQVGPVAVAARHLLLELPHAVGQQVPCVAQLDLRTTKQPAAARGGGLGVRRAGRVQTAGRQVCSRPGLASSWHMLARPPTCRAPSHLQPGKRLVQRLSVHDELDRRCARDHTRHGGAQ